MAEAEERVLYEWAWSPPCLRVHIALEEHQLSFKSHLLSFENGEHKSELIRALNPHCQLPVFEDAGAIVVSESLAAIIWIEERYSDQGNKLMPPLSQRKDRAMVWQRLAESQNLAGKLVTTLHVAAFGRKTLTPEEEKRLGDLMGELGTELGFWESYLSAQPYVAGDNYSLADVATAPYLLLAQHTGASFADFPHIKQYVDRIKARPAVAKVLQQHQQAGGKSGVSEVFKGKI